MTTPITQPTLKPRIRKISYMWACAAPNGVAYGKTPAEAYHKWLKNPQILFKVIE